MTDTKTIMKFPCEFAIKVMGKANSDVEKVASAIIKEHCPSFSGKYNARKSRDGNYIALTFTITAESKAQLDTIYQALHNCENIIMTL